MRQPRTPRDGVALRTLRSELERQTMPEASWWVQPTDEAFMAAMARELPRLQQVRLTSRTATPGRLDD